MIKRATASSIAPTFVHPVAALVPLNLDLEMLGTFLRVFGRESLLSMPALHVQVLCTCLLIQECDHKLLKVGVAPWRLLGEMVILQLREDGFELSALLDLCSEERFKIVLVRDTLHA